MGWGAFDTTVSSDIPERVLLFSGHMVDRPDRRQPHFPADEVAVAVRRIDERLAGLASRPGDIAFARGAAGGGLHLLVPLPEKEFIAASSLPSADGANSSGCGR